MHFRDKEGPEFGGIHMRDEHINPDEGVAEDVKAAEFGEGDRNIQGYKRSQDDGEVLEVGEGSEECQLLWENAAFIDLETAQAWIQLGQRFYVQHRNWYYHGKRLQVLARW